MSRTGRKWRLKRSDSDKQRPDGGLAVISRRRKKKKVVVDGGFFAPRTGAPKNTTPVVVYSTSHVQPRNVWMEPDSNPAFTREVIVATDGQEFNRERQIQKNDNANTVRLKEIRSLKSFIWKIAAIRYERTKIDPRHERVMSQNMAAEIDLKFNESERWGQINQAFTRENGADLPRPLSATMASVNAFLNSPAVKIAIAHEMQRIAISSGVNTGQIIESAAYQAERIALGGCPNGSLLSQARAYRAMRLNGNDGR